ncbi:MULTISPECIES: Crp/Fnr family transcriptional regulator [unclassified Cetobacterium]|uniref:Crp/Fnr family transcriptional regulator n=1 Tax=unclassified Cetobacterium TaxID=2630983 RepID=UPI0006471A51|nr:MULTISPECIES: Crp/Fnr family transcriptional regulator [unclassified Cetobacterium]
MKNEIKYYLKKYNLENCIKNEFLNKLYIKRFQKGEMIFSVEEESQTIYFFVEGKVKVYSAFYGNKEILIEFTKPMQILGEVEYIQNKDINVNVEALTPCIMIGILRTDFKKMISQNDELYELLLKTITDKLTTTMSRVLSYHQQPLEERILDYLKELSNHNKIEKIKYIDMAEYLKISDRHLRKVLKKLVEEQKILKNGKNIQIL